MGKCDGFKLLLQMNPCTLTAYLHNFILDQPFYFGRFGRHFLNNTIKKGNLLFGNSIEMKYSRHGVFKTVQNTRCTTCFKDCIVH